MKIKVLAAAVIIILSLSSCNSVSRASDVTENGAESPAETEMTAENTLQTSPDLDELREKYPEYFELSDFKGIEVYVWQLEENSYQCGLMSGTNRNKTSEELSELRSRSISIDEAKAILNEIGVNKEDIIIIPISHPNSSYTYEIDDEYYEKVNKLFE